MEAVTRRYFNVAVMFVRTSSPRTLYIHVGTHKTGTTSIQRFLTTNAARLHESHGLLIPMAGRPAGFDGHHNVAWELNDDPRFDLASGTLADLAVEIAASDVAAACVSSEDFEYLHDRPDRLYDLARAVDGAGMCAKVVVYFRERHGYARSLYRELLKHGITETEAEFSETVGRKDAFRCRERWIYQFDARKLLAPFQTIFGRENVIVRDYQSCAPDDVLLREFAEIVTGTSFNGLDDFAMPGRLNSSQPLLTCGNVELSSPPSGRADPD